MEILKEIVERKEKNIISTKHIGDEELIELVDYMIQKQSIITRLTLTEGSITKLGISYLASNYPMLFSLDLSDNNLIDEDIKDIPQLTKLKELCVANNLLTAKGVELLKRMNLDYLNVEDNDDRASENQKKLSIF